jgi:G3E family GTPase
MHVRQSVETICIQLDQPVHDIDVLERWIQTLLWEKTIPCADKQAYEQDELTNDQQITVLRLKGIVTPTGSQERIIIQGVQDLYDMQPAIAADSVEESAGKLVFIGRNLEKSKLEASLSQWLNA